MTPDIYFLFKKKYTKQLINPFEQNYDQINKNIVNELINIENDITKYIKLNNNILDYIILIQGERNKSKKKRRFTRVPRWFVYFFQRPFDIHEFN